MNRMKIINVSSMVIIPVGITNMDNYIVKMDQLIFVLSLDLGITVGIEMVNYIGKMDQLPSVHISSDGISTELNYLKMNSMK